MSKATFDQYEQYYNEMNLTKWMLYIKDMGYYSFSRKIKQKHFKTYFTKFENDRKCLSF